MSVSQQSMTASTAPRSSGAPALRSGAEYLRSLNDGRQVFVDGERVADVTRHPAFREAARSVARLYDIAADPANRELMTFPSPKTGAPVWRCYQIPRSHADLRARRLFSEKWAEATFGLMGRSPDHVASFFTGYAAVPGVFAAAGQKFADNVVAFYEKMRDEHLYLSYAIVPPQIDRSKPAHKQSDPTLHAGVVKERDDGIVICRRPAGRDRRRAVGLAASELHPSAAAWRRQLRQLPRGADQRAGPEAYSAPAVRVACRQFVRLSAVEPVRRVRQLRGVRQRVRAVGARVHLSQHRAEPRIAKGPATLATGTRTALAYLRHPRRGASRVVGAAGFWAANIGVLWASSRHSGATSPLGARSGLLRRVGRQPDSLARGWRRRGGRGHHLGVHDLRPAELRRLPGGPVLSCDRLLAADSARDRRVLPASRYRGGVGA